MKLSEFAKELSHGLHANQKRKDGKPYTTHTDYVGDNACIFASRRIYISDYWTEFTKAVGYLHDAVEDQVTANELLQFGKDLYPEWKDVVNNVVILSRPDKNEYVIRYLDGIKVSEVATAVKLADLSHNLLDLGPGNLRDKYHLCQAYLRTT